MCPFHLALAIFPWEFLTSRAGFLFACAQGNLRAGSGVWFVGRVCVGARAVDGERDMGTLLLPELSMERGSAGMGTALRSLQLWAVSLIFPCSAAILSQDTFFEPFFFLSK